MIINLLNDKELTLVMTPIEVVSPKQNQSQNIEQEQQQQKIKYLCCLTFI